MNDVAHSHQDVLVYQYPKCSTCKKALRWLDAAGISYRTQHIVDEPPTADDLHTYVARAEVPLKRFFNTSGQSYRQGGFKERLSSMSIDAQIAALAADGKLIRRPLVVTDTAVLVGFQAETYGEVLRSRDASTT